MESQLTPELVIMALQGGMLDAALPNISEAVRLRKEVLAVSTANNLMVGDRFLVKDCSPKKWNDVEVEFVGREGIWLVTKIVSDLDVRRLHNCDQIYVDHFRKQNFRTSHVGRITSTTQSRAQAEFDRSQGV